MLNRTPGTQARSRVLRTLVGTHRRVQSACGRAFVGVRPSVRLSALRRVASRCVEARRCRVLPSAHESTTMQHNGLLACLLGLACLFRVFFVAFGHAGLPEPFVCLVVWLFGCLFACVFASPLVRQFFVFVSSFECSVARFPDRSRLGAKLFVSAVGVPPVWAVDKLHANGIPVST